MIDFDKWWEENYMNVSADRTEAEDIYNIGSQSQQAKVNDSENTRAVLYRENIDIREKNTDLQAKIELLEVQLKGAEERAKLTLDHKNKMVDELQNKYDAMHNAFIVADDCRKEWHESYMNVRLERDELQARVKQGLKIAEDLMGEMQNYKLGESLENILKGNKDE